MADLGQEFGFRLTVAFRPLTGLLHRALGLLPILEVAQDQAIFALHRLAEATDGKVERDRRSLARPSQRLAPPPFGSRLGAGEIVQRRDLGFTREQKGEILARDLVAVVIEQGFRLAVEAEDGAVGVEQHDAVGGGVKHGLPFLVVDVALAQVRLQQADALLQRRRRRPGEGEEFGFLAVPVEARAMKVDRKVSPPAARASRVFFPPGATSSARARKTAPQSAGIGEGVGVGVAQPVERQPVGVKQFLAARHDQPDRRGFGEGDFGAAGAFAFIHCLGGPGKDKRRRAALALGLQGAGLGSARAERPRDFAKGRTLMRRERDQGRVVFAFVARRRAGLGPRRAVRAQGHDDAGKIRRRRGLHRFLHRRRRLVLRRVGGSGMERLDDDGRLAQAVEMRHAETAPALETAATVENRQAAEGRGRGGAGLFDGPIDIDPAESDARAQGFGQFAARVEPQNPRRVEKVASDQVGTARPDDFGERRAEFGHHIARVGAPEETRRGKFREALFEPGAQLPEAGGADLDGSGGRRGRRREAERPRRGAQAEAGKDEQGRISPPCGGKER